MRTGAREQSHKDTVLTPRHQETTSVLLKEPLLQLLHILTALTTHLIVDPAVVVRSTNTTVTAAVGAPALDTEEPLRDGDT